MNFLINFVDSIISPKMFNLSYGDLLIKAYKSPLILLQLPSGTTTLECHTISWNQREVAFTLTWGMLQLLNILIKIVHLAP